MRQHFYLDWAFAIRHALEKSVKDNLPHELANWPILKTFNFEPYKINDQWGILKLTHKMHGIPAGNSFATEVKLDRTAPQQTPNLNNIKLWLNYLGRILSIGPQDLVILIPYKDGKIGVDEEWKVFTEEEKKMWHIQLDENMIKHMYFMKGFDLTGGFYIPYGYQFLMDNCMRFFDDNPNYSRNVFIMTRYVSGNRLLEELDRELRRVLKQYDLNPLRADDKMYLRDRNIWNNVCVYMCCCKYGIAILEDRLSDEFNPNVAIEYGFMRALNKPTLLLADIGFRNLRADVVGTLREQFDITDIGRSIEQPIKTWISELGLLR